MISKAMYKVLKNIPRFPKDTNSLNLIAKNTLEVNLLFEILQDALNCKYIIYTQSHNHTSYYTLENSSFGLTESGQLQIEEYKNRRGSSRKSTLAIIISGLSFLASVIAIIVSLLGVQ